MKKKEAKGSRRDFLKKGVTGLAGAAILPTVLSAESRAETPSPTPDKKKLVYRTLGRTGFKVPVVSIGAGACNDAKLFEASLDAGIVHIDTANSYGQGRNEEMIGPVIKNRPRDSFVIGTKVVGDHEDRRTGMYTAETKPGPFIEKFETSLGRLQLDYVDILYLHSTATREATLFEPLLSALVKMKEQGKTKSIGVSTHGNEPEVIRAAVESKVYDVVLTAYNFRQPHVADVEKAMAEAAKAGLGIVAMKTQAGVYWDRERQHMINMKAALKWAIQNENVHTTIPGIGTFEHLEENMSVMEDLTLTAEEKESLKLGKEYGFNGLYCRQCRECLAQCDKGVEVPTLMRSYMYAHGYRNLAKAKEALRHMDLDQVACSTCESCRVKCTMGFDIKSKVEDIARIKNVPDDFVI
jgi:predicted aldo/keto reductase-like oxidoreductase